MPFVYLINFFLTLFRKIFRSLPENSRNSIVILIKTRFPVVYNFYAVRFRRNQTAEYSVVNNVFDLENEKLCKSTKARIAIHIHLYYTDLANEFFKKLKNIPFSFDLFISISDLGEKQRLELLFNKGLPKLKSLVIEKVPNKGRDIAPFYVFFGNYLKEYDYVAHFHSKKSLYNKGATHGWREYLTTFLLGSEKQVRRIIEVFENTNTGLIYPQNFHKLPYMANTWLANKNLASKYAAELGIDTLPEGYFDYPAGSMFWAKVEAIRPLFERLNYDDFPEEKGQNDGTLAHVLERLLGILVQSRGYKLYIISNKNSVFWSKWNYEQFWYREKKSHIESIIRKKPELVLFDLFDTLVVRPLLDPEYIKKLVVEYESPRIRENYLVARVKSEAEIRKKLQRDVNIHEIYDEIVNSNYLRKADADRLKQRELELESALIFPRSDVIEFLRDVKETGIPTALVSDTFLPIEIIKVILEKAGLSISDFDDLFLSSEQGKRKDSGLLYEQIISGKELNVSSVVMVGDNERSDFQIPADMGIKTVHFIKHMDLFHSLSPLAAVKPSTPSEKIVSGQISANLFKYGYYNDRSPDGLPQTLSETGYSILGPLFASFVIWLEEKRSEANLKKLVFLSRDGDVIKKVYDKWFSSEKSEYLVISRRSVMVAGINSLLDALAIASENFYDAPLESYLYERFGLILSNAMIKELFGKKIWNPDKPVSIRNNELGKVRHLIEYLYPIIKERALEEKTILIKALEERLPLDSSFAFVDVGYSGTIQKYINRVLNSNYPGLYMMTTMSGIKNADENNTYAFGAFYSGINTREDLPILFKKNFDFERLISSDEKQLIKYDIEKEKVVPVFREQTDAEVLSTKYRKELRDGLFQYIDESISISKKVYRYFKPSMAQAVQRAEIFLDNKDLREINGMAELVIDDHFTGRGIVV